MKKLFGIVSSFILTICLCMPVYALDIPESVSDYYLDDANVMTTDTKEYITEKNWAMDQHCGGYIEIVTEKYINCDVADYTYEIFNQWQIGGSENNNGILLVVVTEEEKYYVMYGRGIEQKVDSYVFQEIMETYFEKDFDAGNYDTAIKNTFDALYDELCTLYGTPSSSGSSSSSSTTPKTSFLSRIISLFIGGISMFVFIIIFIIVLFLFSRRGPRGPYGGGGWYHRGPRPPMGGGPGGGHFGGGHSGGSFGGHSGGGSFGGRSSGGSSRGGGFGRR